MVLTANQQGINAFRHDNMLILQTLCSLLQTGWADLRWGEPHHVPHYLCRNWAWPLIFCKERALDYVCVWTPRHSSFSSCKAFVPPPPFKNVWIHPCWIEFGWMRLGCHIWRLLIWNELVVNFVKFVEFYVVRPFKVSWEHHHQVCSGTEAEYGIQLCKHFCSDAKSRHQVISSGTYDLKERN